jgi:hypothetical protein
MELLDITIGGWAIGTLLWAGFALFCLDLIFGN